MDGLVVINEVLDEARKKKQRTILKLDFKKA